MAASYTPTPGYVRKAIKEKQSWGNAYRKVMARRERPRALDLAKLNAYELVPAFYPGFVEPRHLGPIVDAIDCAQRGETVCAVIAAPPQHGKALDVATPMLTKRGWVTAGDVVVGDELVSSSGGWTKVLAVYPQGVIPLHRVEFSDGKCHAERHSLRACGEHLWTVRRRWGKFQTLSTDELSGNLHAKDGRNKWRLPMAKPLVGQPWFLPIDPYLLGAWLGDGSSRTGQITTADIEILDAFTDAGYRVGARVPAGAANSYTLKGFRGALRCAGLLQNKHVPEMYHRAPAVQRLALLQGLCDTDGTVAKNGSQQSYCSTDPRLADDFCRLVTSLGGTWSICTKPAAAKIAHNIYFRLPHGMPAFRLQRKARLLNADSARNEVRRFISDIQPDGQGEAVCFTVDAPDSLFAAGKRLVLTHNTLSIKSALAKLAATGDQHSHSGYFTYNDTKGQHESKQTRQLLTNIEIKTSGNLHLWAGPNGADILFSGIGGSVTGFPLNKLAVVDDAIKNRKEAESLTIRNTAWDFLKSVFTTRCHPGTSKLIVATRWHEDDPSGRAVKEWGWDYINLQAISDETGEALWPAQRPLSFLREVEEQLGAYDWAALYQGQPRPRGGAVFGEPHYFDRLPERYQVGYGCDLAYTAKSKSDYSVLIRFLTDGQFYYITDVWRMQVRAPQFIAVMLQAHRELPGPMLWHCAGTEKAAADFAADAVKSSFAQYGAQFRYEPARGDKFTRSLPVASAWNAGRILLPSSVAMRRHRNGSTSPFWRDSDTPPAWFSPFIGTVCGFTGVKDLCDDDVDALGSGYALMSAMTRRRQPRPSTGYVLG